MNPELQRVLGLLHTTAERMEAIERRMGSLERGLSRNKLTSKSAEKEVMTLRQQVAHNSEMITLITKATTEQKP
ncbi:MAG: hypothetical protein CME61_08765 [Halobacteriovoraceae bacterium]|nr:hypothetical protein [Halobacteriovoraceae bacterium]